MEFSVKYSNRKTISIKITSVGDVVVFAPINTQLKTIEDFINSKKNWVLKHQNRIKNNINSNLSIINKQKFLYLGNIIDYNNEKIKTLVNDGCNYLINRCKELSLSLNLPINSVKIKNYKGRWGSCDVNKNVILNKKLIMLDKSVIDFVIIHELCHTIYMNHKKTFHLLLNKYIIDEKPYKQALKKYSFLLKLDF